MLEQKFQRLNQFSKHHKRFVKPNKYDGNSFKLKRRFTDEKTDNKVDRDFIIKHGNDLRTAKADVAKQNNATNRIILIIASILMFLVWLILR